ncbi:UNVERIFIED_CONTAM: Chaperone protein dnaJ 15 [Sesamum indicum]
MGGSKTEGSSATVSRRDPYEVLSVSRDSSDLEIKTAYRKLALKCADVDQDECPENILITGNLWYHPDKNSNNPEASELFQEVAYSYSILSDPEKRRQYDIAGFEAIEAKEMDMEIDLSNLGTVNTVFAALFSKLGVPIKTTIPATVLEEALSGTPTVRPLPIGNSVSGKVEKQCAHFFSVSINEEQAEAGIVVRVTSAAQSKFKLLYFEHEANGGYGLALQGCHGAGHGCAGLKPSTLLGNGLLCRTLDLGYIPPSHIDECAMVFTMATLFCVRSFLEECERTGKVTTAGMYFLRFQVYRMDSTMNALAMAKDPEAAFFKRLEGLQPCEVSELKAGTHIFAVYGDNFFKPASYTIEALCAKSYEDTTHKLKDIEAQLLKKRNELRQFEIEYRKAVARFQEVTSRYSQEKQSAVAALIISVGNRHDPDVEANWLHWLLMPASPLSMKGVLARSVNRRVGVIVMEHFHDMSIHVDELLKQRDSIHSSFTVARSLSLLSGSAHFGNSSSSKSWRFSLSLKGLDKK